MSVINAAHIETQREFSEATFGPGSRLLGVLDHIRKELVEIEADPTDLEEWTDALILVLDGAWRAGFTGAEIIAEYHRKIAKNRARIWPDWRTADRDRAIEHVRGTS